MQAGFCEVMDTEAMFRKAFAEMQAKLLPPRWRMGKKAGGAARGDAPAAGRCLAGCGKAASGTRNATSRNLAGSGDAGEEETTRDALSRRPAPSVTLDGATNTTRRLR